LVFNATFNNISAGFGHDASQNVAKSVLTEENFFSMLKWKT
jgi:hypothetical protein